MGREGGFCSCLLVLRGHLLILGSCELDGEDLYKQSCHILIVFLIVFIFERLYASSKDSKCSEDI